MDISGDYLVYLPDRLATLMIETLHLLRSKRVH